MISTLRLQNFRCFDALALEFPESGAVMVGANAQGKTSILEAVCVMVRLQSPRSTRMSRMVKMDTSGFGVAGRCWDNDLQVRYTPRKGVTMKMGGEPVVKQGDYLRSGGLVVWMGNDDLQLVRGSGSVRRRYLDFLGCQLDPLYRDHLNRYTRVLKARNLLLKDRTQRDAEMVVYSDLLVRHGEFLTAARRRLVGMLEPESAASQVAVSGCDERVGMQYIAGSGDDLAASLEMTRERERRLGQTVAGPHRDEVRLTINGMVAADFASEGQQRTMALSLKLAQGQLLHQEAHRLPVYLLDDIFGELDPDRRNALMAVLPKKAQKLITTTNIDWMQDEFSMIEMADLPR
ncbi:MAG: DNA replication and repair protein RecF [Verrucomicrobiae bacterium]|nr:DNA replication and repair protein RecF [Verrucomicrobiae bacterium]NNJ42425.1 DNA replication and repair protein RecF [Akkermansiaceae bacterium]